MRRELRPPAKTYRVVRLRGRNHRKAAKELGLVKGIKVFGGGMDASLIGVGAGSTELGETHIYSGTSGWVSTVTDKSAVDVTTMIAATVAAQPGKFNYFAELETSGKCLEWVKDHIALDEVGIYIQKNTSRKILNPNISTCINI